MADNWLEKKMDDYRQAKAAGALKPHVRRATTAAPVAALSPQPEVAGKRVLVTGDELLLRPIVAVLVQAGASVSFLCENKGLARLIAIETGATPITDAGTDLTFDRVVEIKLP